MTKPFFHTLSILAATALLSVSLPQPAGADALDERIKQVQIDIRGVIPSLPHMPQLTEASRASIQDVLQGRGNPMNGGIDAEHIAIRTLELPIDGELTFTARWGAGVRVPPMTAEQTKALFENEHPEKSSQNWKKAPFKGGAGLGDLSYVAADSNGGSAIDSGSSNGYGGGCMVWVVSADASLWVSGGFAYYPGPADRERKSPEVMQKLQKAAIHDTEEIAKKLWQALGGRVSADPTRRDPSQGNPWDDSAVQRAIDEWLRISRPTSPPNGRWTEWGQAVGSGISAAGPPDHGSMSRYEYLWRNASKLGSVAHGTLEEYLRTHGGGGPSDPGAAQQEPAQGVSRTTLQVGKRRPREGESINVPIWILRGDAVGSLNVELRYDPSVVKVDGEVAQGNVADVGMFEANGKESGVVLVGLVSTKGVSGTGTLAVIPFRAVGAAGARSALTLSVTAAGDTKGGTPAIDLMHGEVIIVGPEGVIPGDSNGDGTLDERDARAALRMSVRKIPENLALDMDKDGKVTAKDALQILQQAARGQGR